MIFIEKVLFLLFLTLLWVNLSMSQSSNGCGPKGFSINNGLRQIGENNLIQCCDQHDICYGNFN